VAGFSIFEHWGQRSALPVRQQVKVIDLARRPTSTAWKRARHQVTVEDEGHVSPAWARGRVRFLVTQRRRAELNALPSDQLVASSSGARAWHAKVVPDDDTSPPFTAACTGRPWCGAHRRVIMDMDGGGCDPGQSETPDQGSTGEGPGVPWDVVLRQFVARLENEKEETASARQWRA
jgi:hypothetical protein